MGTEPIELLKTYTNGKNLPYPACMQQKFDGVPLRFFNQGNGVISNLTRQNEVSMSVNHLHDDLALLLDEGGWLIGEMYRADLPFKTISGLVRKDAPAPSLVCMVFDADIDNTGGSWFKRQVAFRTRLMEHVRDKYNHEYLACPIRPISNVRVATAAEAETAYAKFCANNPNAEGVVYHSCDAEFQPGTRRWHVQKRVRVPSLDLEVVGFEEALSQYNEPLGMVGRVIVSYRGGTIGAGPGKLNHRERVELWQQYNAGAFNSRLAQISYKIDPSYGKLREARFTCWRPDKDTSDA